MKLELWQCDICKKQYKEQKNIENSVSIINSTMISYEQVCKRCVREIIKTIEQLEPKEK